DWFYMDNEDEIQLTNALGQSITPYPYASNIEAYAKWTETYHLIEFIDGQNNVIYTETVRHREYLEQYENSIPLKQSDRLYVYRFLRWQFDFENTQILKPYNIRADYETIDRYYENIYLDGDGNVFD